MKDTDIQWHPGFVAAINLELIKNRNDLMFEKEYNLNTKPLEVDLLIIKKNSGIEVENKIGQIFRGHNILEYKCPKDQLDIDTYYKVVGYASLYKSYGKTVDCIKAEDVTISLVRDVKPLGLFRYFAEHHCSVSSPYKGIYYIEGPVLFPTQVIVTKELNRKDHIWLRSLSEELEQQDMQDLLKAVRQLTGKYDRELADSVLEVSIQANEQIIEKLIGDESMSQALLDIMEPIIIGNENMSKALLDIMEPKINKIKETVRAEVTEQVTEQVTKAERQKGIKNAIVALRVCGQGDAAIKKAIMEAYGISAREVEEYL